MTGFVHAASVVLTLLSFAAVGVVAGGAQPQASTRKFSRRAMGTLLGRNQGPEMFFQQAFTALTAPIIPRNINLTRPIEAIHLVWRGRVAITVANITNPAAESPQTIIQRIRLTGTHRQYNQLVPIDISGATAFAWLRCFQPSGNELIINGAKQADLGMPLSMPVATFGGTANSPYDLEIHYIIPITPMFPPNSRVAVTPFLYQPQDWADSLQLQLFFGDGTSFGTAGATIAFTAFGSGAGSPTVTIFTNYSILGPLANSVNSAVVIRSENTIVGGPVAAVANAQRLTLLQKQKTTNVMVKAGILLTATSAGVTVYQTLQDTLLDRMQINVDNKPVRNNFANFAAKAHFGRQFSTHLPGGYNGFTFIDSQNPLTYYRGDQVPGGSTFELDSDVLLAAANQAVSITQEQVFGEPGGK